MLSNAMKSVGCTSCLSENGKNCDYIQSNNEYHPQWLRISYWITDIIYL